VFADAQIVMPNVGDQRAHLAKVAGVLASRPRAFLELANEYAKNGVDPANFVKPAGVLSAAGSLISDSPPFLPPWDYVTHHGRRTEDWPRDAKGSGDLCCLGWSDDPSKPPVGVYVVQDEPMGAGEVASGSRSTVARDFGDFAATAAMWGGATFHSDAGIFAVPFGPTQRASAYEFYRSMAFVPADAPLWPYQRGGEPNGPGVGNMPINHDDALDMRSFCKSDAAESWCVQIRTTRDHATARDGWAVAEEPRPGLVRLMR
jgi:hypothetical protein